MGSQAANTCHYLGTAYMTANGQTGWNPNPAAASGGSSPFVAIFNAYNRVPVSLICEDSTSVAYTYASSTYRPLNNSTSNRCTVIDGLQVVPINAALQDYVQGAASTAADIGIYLDAISGNPTSVAESIADTFGLVVSTAGAFLPQLGQHFIQGAEARSGSGTATFLPARSSAPVAQFSVLRVEWWY